jgi:hypothetical protein
LQLGIRQYCFESLAWCSSPVALVSAEKVSHITCGFGLMRIIDSRWLARTGFRTPAKLP